MAMWREGWKIILTLHKILNYFIYIYTIRDPRGWGGVYIFTQNIDSPPKPILGSTTDLYHFKNFDITATMLYIDLKYKSE